MKDRNTRELNARFRQQYGVAGRSELRRLGVTAKLEAAMVQAGRWERFGRRTIGLAGAPRTPEQRLMIACIETGPGSVASHGSAAWLWQLTAEPRRPSVTVPRTATARVDGIDVHRPVEPLPRTASVRGIPCTDPLRTLIDLAAVCSLSVLDDAIDRGLSTRLVSVEAITAELARVSERGRGGAGGVRQALRRRGFAGAPSPSVLESRTLRLLERAGIAPLEVEAKVGPNGRYRVDTLLDPNVAMEVDGFAYHSSPEAKAEDERRRARIRLSGMFVLVYDWMDITRDGHRVVSECWAALAAHGRGPQARRRRPTG